MVATRDSTVIPIALPARRGLRWCAEGLRLWRRVPVKLFLLALAALLIELLLQLIPWAGVTLSKIVVPLVDFGILVGLHDHVCGRRMRWTCIAAAFARRPLPPVMVLAAVYGLGVFAVQQLAAFVVYGWTAVDAVWLGHVAAHRALESRAGFEYVLLLPGLAPSVLLLLAPGIFLFNGASTACALRTSIRTVLRNPAPFAVFLLVNLGVFLVMLAKPWLFALVVLVMPWSLAASYVAWRDACGSAATVSPVG